MAEAFFGMLVAYGLIIVAAQAAELLGRDKLTH